MECREIQDRVQVNGRVFIVRVVDVQRVDLTYQCYCIAESEDNDVVEYLIAYTTIWVLLQQRKGLLPKGDPSAFKDALKKLALERAAAALRALKRSQKITITADGRERTEDIKN